VLFNTTHVNEAAVSDSGLSILDGDQRVEIIRLRDEFDGIYTSLIEAGQKKGVFAEGDPTILKNAITPACARIYLWYRPDGRHTPDRLAETLSHYLISGLQPASSSTEVAR
jgi:hypothetical protein